MKEQIDILNNYFKLNKDNYTLIDLLRLVSRIQDHGYIINFNDLNDLNKLSDFRIWFNKIDPNTHGLIECSYGQISQSSSVIGVYTKDDTLESCLIYSISEWCQYHKIYDEHVIFWSRKMTTVKDRLKYEGHITYNNEKIILFRIYDEDEFILEFVGETGEIIRQEMNDTSSDIIRYAECIALSNIVNIYKNLNKYKLNK